ncbi:hypothetical protein SGPA1_21587 [Streptomyces misionensis JCM 4497]
MTAGRGPAPFPGPLSGAGFLHVRSLRFSRPFRSRRPLRAAVAVRLPRPPRHRRRLRCGAPAGQRVRA